MVEELVCDLVHWHMYRNNPARCRIDCARADLSGIKLAQVRQFIRDRYTTESMFVILIGPKNNEAVEKVREYFGDLPQRSPAPLAYDHSDDFPVLDSIRSFELVRRELDSIMLLLLFQQKGIFLETRKFWMFLRLFGNIALSSV